VQLAHRRLHHALAGLVQDDVLVQLARPHVGVGQETGAGEALLLPLPGRLDAGADRRRRFAGPAVGQFLVLDAGDLNVDVDPVEQRAADPLLVAPNGPRRASARPDGAPR
jgi:hypothetical protein